MKNDHPFEGGDGSPSAPWQIANPAQLDAVRDYLWEKFVGAHFILTRDIDLQDYLAEGGSGYNSGALWEPLGNSTDRFRGVFHGNGHRIRNLRINRPNLNQVGLFGFVGSGGELIDLSLEIDSEGSVSGRGHVGGLAGYILDAQVDRCSVSGSVTATENRVGGLIGLAQDSTITRSHSRGSVYGPSYMGGLIGVLNNSALFDSYSRSSVTSYNNGMRLGGLVGNTDVGAEIDTCYSTGLVTSTGSYVGGLVGLHSGAANQPSPRPTPHEQSRGGLN